MWSPKKAMVNCINCVVGGEPKPAVSGDTDANGFDKTLRPVSTPVAVVGMACRLPGNVTDPSKLWDLCANGPSRDESPSPTPTLSERSGVDSAYYTDSPGDSSPRRKTGDLKYSSKEDSSLFNGDFLGVPADELNALESETRLLLKTVYEATENAGIPIGSLGGTSTSVFTGFHGESLSCPHVIRAENSTSRGDSSTQLSSSVSNLFDLRGASMSIDTACSSGLVSLHQACETIRSGESQVSIVGAVDTASRSSHQASSAAVLVLKRLDAAIRDGDQVHCVIKATGLNHNGRAKEVSIESQKQLIQAVYQRAGLSPDETAYLETNLPEASDLSEILGGSLKEDDPLMVGSVAADLGHDIGPVQGLASIIKGAFAIRNRQPQTANKRFRTSVHNAGCGGANAHAILEAAPRPSPSTQTNGALTESEPTSRVFLLSAEDANTTRAMARNLGTRLRKGIEEEKNVSLADLAYTLAERRSRLSYKAVVRAGSLEELIEALDRPDLKILTTVPNKRRLGFVFNGQGAQWHAMGRELLSTYPVFASAIKEADGILRGFGADWSLEEELTRDTESTRVSEINISQPITVALQLALVNLLRSWHINPSAVVSHSTGEFAAAYAAGALSFSQALGIVYHLGDLARKYYGGSQISAGGMAAAAISAKEVEKYLTNTTAGGKVVVACINSPKSVTLSGNTDALDEVLKRLDDDGVFARKLKVPLAYHSHHILSFEAEYTERLRQLFSSTSKSEQTLPGEKVVYISPVTGDVVASPLEVLTPEYYVRNITSPVLFSDAFKAFSEHIDEVVEIGPHSTLSGPIREILREAGDEERDIEYMTCLKRPVDAMQTMQDLACDLVTLGYPVSLRDVNNPRNKDQKLNFVPDLPSYPWSSHISGTLTPEKDDSSSGQRESEDVITTSKLSWELDILHNIPDQIKDSIRIDLSQDEIDREKTLTRASFYLISDAVQKLQQHAQHSPAPNQKETLEWMTAIVKLGKQGGFGPGSALWPRATPGMKQLLYDELSQGKYGAAGELIVRLGVKLGDIVRDNITPAGLAKDTNELVHRYYTELPMLKSRTYKHLSQVTELFALKSPGARVLEIGGAGAGGATRAVLEAFGSRSSRGGTLLGSYVFTHNDASVLETARQYLSAWDLDDDNLIEYKTLDIEQELSDSLPVGAFDLIVASLALGTQEGGLNKTLLNARKLLKPGGRLFLVDTTRDRLDVELVSRSLCGHPLSLPIEDWDKTLRDTGFTGVNFEIGDCEQPQYQSSSFIMSTAAPDTALSFPSAVSVLYTTPILEAWHKKLSAAIRENIPSVSVVKAERLDTFEPPAEGDDEKIYIFTGDVTSSGPLVDGINEASFLKLQRLVRASQRILWFSQSGAVDAQEPSYATAFEFLRNSGRLDTSTDKRIVHLDFESSSEESWVNGAIDHIVHVLRATMDINVPLSGVDMEYAVWNGMLHVPRVLPVDGDVARDEEIPETDKPIASPDTTVLLVSASNASPGGIGGELASWVIDQGVRNLLVASRGSQPDALLQKVEAEKCNIQFRDCDVSLESDLLDLLKDVGSSSSVPPIRGVVVIDNLNCDNASALEASLPGFDQWEKSTVRKAAAIRNLDTHLPSDLDFFVLLSPFDSSLASAQISSSSFQDSFGPNRTTAGRPITNVHIPISHPGEDQINGADATSTTTLAVPDLLSRAISDAIRHPPVSQQDSQIIVGLPQWNKLPADSPLRTDPRFRTLQLGVQRKRRATISSSEVARRSSPSELLLQALEGNGNGEDSIVQALQAQLAVLLRLQAAEEIDLTKPLATYGVDSIVAIEVRTWLAETTEGKTKLSVLEILNADSLYNVAKMVGSRARKGQSAV